MSEQKELLALSDATLTAAFFDGVEQTRAAEARQAEIDRKIAKEREKSGDSADNSSERRKKDKNKKKNPSNFTLEDSVNEASLTLTQREDIKLIRRLSECIPGIRFVITNEGVDNDGNYKALDNGYYSDGEKTVYIDISAGRKTVESAVDFAIAFAGVHEVAHAIKANAPALWEELESYVIDTYYPGKSLDYVVKMRMEEYQKQENKRAAAADEEPREITYDYALEEVIANSLERMLRSERVMFKLAKGHRRLFSRIWQYIRDFFNRVIRKIGQYSHRTVESTIVERANKSQRKLEDLFVKALRAASDGAAATRNESAGTNSEVRHSYAGKSAVTADKMKLSTAKEMLANGADSETVRKETGWFKGYDGKWRFEIDDSSVEITIPQNRTSKLSDILRHDALFEAYPELKNIYVTFDDSTNGSGSYSRTLGDITLSKDLLSNKKELCSVLMHEVQHAVQDIENFSRGASIKYWERRLEEGYDGRQSYVKEEEKDLLERMKDIRINDREFLDDMELLDTFKPDHPRGKIDWDTLEQIEEDSPAWKSYDRRRDALVEKWGQRKVWDFFVLSDKLERIKHTGERYASDLYLETAGEVEARDVSKRLEYDSEKRKNTRPDIDRSDVVFAENSNVSYALAKDAESEVDDALSNKYRKDFVKLTDGTPSILLAQKGVRNYPMLMKPSHVRENILTEAEAKARGYKVDEHTHYHGLGKPLFLKVIEELDKVTEAYRGTKNAENPARREKYFLLISKQTDTAGNIINVPVYINDKGDYHRVIIDTNKLATVFGREELRNYIRKELRLGNLVKIKNRSHLTSDSATEIDAQYGKNASAWETPDNSNPTTTMVAQYEIDVSNNSISDSNEKSNTFSQKSSENSGNKKFSHKGAEGREALIEAFSTLAKTDSEKLVIDKYRRELSNIEEKIRERGELQDKLEELKGKSGKAQERTELNARILSLTDYITRHDGKLLELRELAPFRDVMTRYADLSFQRGVDRKEREVRMSRGSYQKAIAEYTHARVYTKRDAERALEKITDFKSVKGKLRDDVINELWEKVNAIESPSVLSIKMD